MRKSFDRISRTPKMWSFRAVLARQEFPYSKARSLRLMCAGGAYSIQMLGKNVILEKAYTGSIWVMYYPNTLESGEDLATATKAARQRAFEIVRRLVRP